MTSFATPNPAPAIPAPSLDAWNSAVSIREILKRESEKSDKKHGGARINAGRPRTPIDMKRVKALRAQQFSYRAIAERLGVTEGVVRRAVNKEKLNA